MEEGVGDEINVDDPETVSSVFDETGGVRRSSRGVVEAMMAVEQQEDGV